MKLKQQQQDQWAIDFHEDGTLSMVGDMPVVVPGLKVIERRRLSNIWPVNPVKRLAFRVIRRVFGDTGTVAEWTRCWAGPWSVHLIEHNNMVAFTHLQRWACVRWERAYFNGE